MTSFQPNGYGSPPPSRRLPAGRIVLAALVTAALLAAAFLTGRATGGTDSDDTPGKPAGSAVASPYGPASFTDGIPHGYTHDQGGAAAASLNIVVAAGLCGAGTIDCAKAQQTLAVDNPSTFVRGYLTNRSQLQLIRPLAVLSADAAADKATVRIWFANVASPAGAGQGADPSVTFKTSYSTVTLEMAWQHDDWRLSAITDATSGPDPTATPAASAFSWVGSEWILYTGTK